MSQTLKEVRKYLKEVDLTDLPYQKLKNRRIYFCTGLNDKLLNVASVYVDNDGDIIVDLEGAVE